MRSQDANQMVDSGQTKIKICGLYRDADIDTVNQYQPDYAGFVFYPPSHRYVTWEQMKDFQGKVAVRDPGSGCMCKLGRGGGGSAPEGRSYPDCSASWNGR